MQEELLRTLENCGLSQNESIIYLTLIKTGLATASDIAKHSKLHRPNVYDSLNSLIEKGLVTHITDEKTKKFKASEPKTLLNLVKQREIDILKAMPLLELEEKLAKKNEPFAEVCHGVNAYRLCVFNMLEYNKTFYSFGIPKIVPVVLGSWLELFHKERIKRKIHFIHIYNEDAKERMAFLNSLPDTEAFYLPERFNSPVSTVVCGPEVLIVRWEPVIFIRIVDQNLATAYKNYCEQLLQDAKKD